MFIIVPSILIGISLIGIALIVRRKLSYLRKLSPDSHEVGEHLWDDYFPELIHWLGHTKWRESRQAVLRETEKLLRRMRLVLLKVDHISDRLIKKVRRVHLTGHLENTASQLGNNETLAIEPSKPAEITPEDLKAREQQLIIEIAQNPKNPELYETLGDLYVKMGSAQDAQEAYEAALGFDPDNQALARKYSVLLKKTETSA